MGEPDDVPHAVAHAEVATAGAGVTSQAEDAGAATEEDSEDNDGLDSQHAD